ncbi:ECF transporter S component [Ornithinibacillus californiensis]|uniref:ECF transporter S component n=1 Tax=Ornithinibacillus californiensis TaxID=161536 RepID=UPI00064D8E29|nr:ECF transporter S component [Ornithinibacillus californiensis]
MNIYKITLLALLATLAVVGRIATNPIPNVQPVTSVIIIGGMFLGPVAGVILAILVTFLSNMILGTGIWTIWQIISWGIIGIISGFIGKKITEIPFFVIVSFSIFSGYLFGFIMSLTNYQITGQGFLAYYLLSLPFDTSHAIGNALFMILLYPVVSRVFKKYIKNHLNTN